MVRDPSPWRGTRKEKVPSGSILRGSDHSPGWGGAVGEAEPVEAASQDELIRIDVSILQVVDLEENRGELLVEDRRVEGELPGAVHEGAVRPQAVALRPVRDDEGLSLHLLVPPPGDDGDIDISLRDGPLVVIRIIFDIYPLGEDLRGVPGGDGDIAGDLPAPRHVDIEPAGAFLPVLLDGAGGQGQKEGCRDGWDMFPIMVHVCFYVCLGCDGEEPNPRTAPARCGALPLLAVA